MNASPVLMTHPSLTLSRYRFALTADDPMLLPPYKGSTLRGGFGHAFKRMVCFQPRVKTCRECLLRYTCPYAYVFETPVPPETAVLSKNEYAPRPLVIEASAEEKTTYFPGDNLDFHIVLVGRAQQYLPYFLVAFQELGRQGLGRSLDLPGGRRRGCYHLARVEAVAALDDAREMVYDAAQPTHIHAQSLPVDERHTLSKEYLESTLTVFMGGRVAELLVFDQLDTGAGNDLERATKLARKMVCNWGMSEKIGPITFGKTEEHIFLGREIQQHQDYSEATAVMTQRTTIRKNNDSVLKL